MLHHRKNTEYVGSESRFQDLIGHDKWQSLPAAVRRRFDKRLTGDGSVVYKGTVVAMDMNFAGWTLAQLARLIGGPLPFDRSCAGRPAIVSVTEDSAGDGQFWMRQYGRASGFPQVIHSSKRFSGPTGIEEYVGCGIGMALTVSAAADGLTFTSDHYFLQLGNRRLPLPKWLQPGELTIVHRDLGNARFLFSLVLTHAVFGTLVNQDVIFSDNEEHTDG